MHAALEIQDIHLHIGHFLEPQDLKSCSLVSRSWNRWYLPLVLQFWSLGWYKFEHFLLSQSPVPPPEHLIHHGHLARHLRMNTFNAWVALTDDHEYSDSLRQKVAEAAGSVAAAPTTTSTRTPAAQDLPTVTTSSIAATSLTTIPGHGQQNVTAAQSPPLYHDFKMTNLTSIALQQPLWWSYTDQERLSSDLDEWIRWFISQNQRLEQFHLDGCQFNPCFHHQIRLDLALVETLSRMPHLTWIKLETTEAHLRAITAILQKCRQLETLILVGTRFDIDSGLSLGKIYPRKVDRQKLRMIPRFPDPWKSSVKHLVLENRIRLMNFTAITQLLSVCTELESLRLEGYGTSEYTTDWIDWDMYNTSLPKLKKLTIQSSGFQRNEICHLIRATVILEGVGGYLRDQQNQKSVEIGNRIGENENNTQEDVRKDKDRRSAADKKYGGNLEELNLPSCSIYAEDIGNTMLATARQQDRIQVLNLCGTGLSSSDLIDILITCSNLRVMKAKDIILEAVDIVRFPTWACADTLEEFEITIVDLSKVYVTDKFFNLLPNHSSRVRERFGGLIPPPPESRLRTQYKKRVRKQDRHRKKQDRQQQNSQESLESDLDKERKVEIQGDEEVGMSEYFWSVHEAGDITKIMALNAQAVANQDIKKLGQDFKQQYALFKESETGETLDSMPDHLKELFSRYESAVLGMVPPDEILYSLPRPISESIKILSVTEASRKVCQVLGKLSQLSRLVLDSEHFRNQQRQEKTDSVFLATNSSSTTPTLINQGKSSEDELSLALKDGGLQELVSLKGLRVLKVVDCEFHGIGEEEIEWMKAQWRFFSKPETEVSRD